MGRFLVLLMVLIPFTSYAELAKDRVNYHLKRMETKLQMGTSEARIKSLNPPTLSTPSDQELEGPAYDPVFFSDVPQVLKQKEARSERNPSQSESSGMTDAEFIEAFRKEAAKRGVRVQIDPVTFEVREVK